MVSLNQIGKTNILTIMLPVGKTVLILSIQSESFLFVILMSFSAVPDYQQKH